MDKTKAAMILVTQRSLGIHICHFEGLRQVCLFCDSAGLHTGGGVRGSDTSSSRPISDRLPTVCRLVIAKKSIWHRHEGSDSTGDDMGEKPVL
jgi:hypothetical protein